jgi:alpha-tubulin suppressor-like RCC1 family protein
MRTLKISSCIGASVALLSLWACTPGGPPMASSASAGAGGGQGGSTAASGGDAATSGDTAATGIVDATASSGAGGAGGASNVARIALGDEHSCALKTTGELFCWGHDGLRGALGSGQLIESSSVPLQVKDTTGLGYLSGVTDVAAGYDHTCAVLSGGKLVCFGNNIVGQLGNDSGMSSSLPVTVKGEGGVGELAGVKKVACGSYLTCAIAGDSVYCWGLGPLGDGTFVGSQVPVKVLDADGTGPFKDAVDVAIGEEHICIRRFDKTLHCFGNNTNGQLGVGSTMNGKRPVQVKNVAGQPGFLSGVDEIARMGSSHSCARIGGAVACWGEDSQGQLGVSAPELCSEVCARVPWMVPGIAALNPAVEITSGDAHTCARLADGSIVCWGKNTLSELGGAPNSACPQGNVGSCSVQPVTVTTAANVPFAAIYVASGSGEHTCAIAPDSTVWCWGENTEGQLGDGTTKSSMHPVPVVGL